MLCRYCPPRSTLLGACRTYQAPAQDRIFEIAERLDGTNSTRRELNPFPRPRRRKDKVDYPEGYSGRINLRAAVDNETDIDGYSIYIDETGSVRNAYATRSAEVSMHLDTNSENDRISLSEVPNNVLSKFQRQLELFDQDSVLDESDDQGVNVTETVVDITFNNSDRYLVDERAGYYAAKKNGERVDRSELPADVREYSDWVIGVEED